MASFVDELWTVALTAPQVDAAALATAIEAAAGSTEPLDYRTRLLIRHALAALEKHWGADRFAHWLEQSRVAIEVEGERRSAPVARASSEVGFPSLARRVVDVTKPETVLEFFRLLSRHARHPTRLDVGGSLALILRDLLARRTEDVDVVDEVPAELRGQHELLQQLSSRFGLQLAHFQSHYLPDGWRDRLQFFQAFGELEVYLVDTYDVMVSKLCSKREKDLDDLRALKPRTDRELLRARLIGAGAGLLSEPRSREAAEYNWYVLFGAPLPGSNDAR